VAAAAGAAREVTGPSRPALLYIANTLLESREVA